MTPAEALDGAADYIEEHGWLQGAFRDSGGRVCAEGALNTRYGFAYEAFHALSRHLGVDSVADWNDAEHRTKEQVVKELRACAQSLRGEK